MLAGFCIKGVFGEKATPHQVIRNSNQGACDLALNPCWDIIYHGNSMWLKKRNEELCGAAVHQHCWRNLDLLSETYLWLSNPLLHLKQLYKVSARLWTDVKSTVVVHNFNNSFSHVQLFLTSKFIYLWKLMYLMKVSTKLQCKWMQIWFGTAKVTLSQHVGRTMVMNGK